MTCATCRTFLPTPPPSPRSPPPPPRVPSPPLSPLPPLHPPLPPNSALERNRHTSSGDWASSLASLSTLLEATPWRYDVCIGELSLTMSNDIRLAGSDGDRGKSGGSMNANGKSAIRIVRNTGGGTSQCCSRFPVAAPARVLGPALQIKLEPRQSWHGIILPNRNGGRIYFAEASGTSACTLPNVLFP